MSRMSTIRKQQQEYRALKLLKKLYVSNRKFYDFKITLDDLLSIHKEARIWFEHRGFHMVPGPHVGYKRWATSSLQQNNKWIGKPFSNWFDPIEVKEALGSKHLLMHRRNILRIRNTNPYGEYAHWLIVDTTPSYCDTLQCHCCKKSHAA